MKNLETLKSILAIMESCAAPTIDDLPRGSLNVIGQYIDGVSTDHDSDSDYSCVVSDYINMFHHGEYSDEWRGHIYDLQWSEHKDIPTDIQGESVTIVSLQQVIDHLGKPKQIQFVNMTPHPINIRGDKGEIIMDIPPSGTVARCEEHKTKQMDLAGVEVNRVKFGKSNIPPEQPGVYYIVSILVAQSLPNRKDLLVPGEQIRDSQGRVIGCKSLNTLAD